MDTETRVIYLPNGVQTVVDAELHDHLSQWKWKYTKGYVHRYAYLGRKDGHSVRQSILMHRLILPSPEGLFVDHINGNPLDNRRVNLRLATNQQNQANRGMQNNNTSGYKGVHWHKKARRWEAYIRVDKKRLYLGLYDTPELAHNAYMSAAQKYFGCFAHP